jgi:hypothetical protein
MTSSPIPSNSFTNARREFPCAAITTVLPDLSTGAMLVLKYGETRSSVDLRLSVHLSGKSNPAYLSYQERRNLVDEKA